MAKVEIPERSDGRCWIVAEVSGNHCGSYVFAARLVEAAAEAGADAVKFQYYTLPEIKAERGNGKAPPPWSDSTYVELAAKNRTPGEWLGDLFALARRRGLTPFSTFMGKRSLALLESIRCPIYKLASYEAGKSHLRLMAQATGKPLIRSSSGPMPHAAPDRVLYCPPGYPATKVRCGLLRFCDGISLHSKNLEIFATAVAAGAKIIETHLMLPDTHPLDEAFSLNPLEFAWMVRRVRYVESLL